MLKGSSTKSDMKENVGNRVKPSSWCWSKIYSGSFNSVDKMLNRKEPRVPYPASMTWDTRFAYCTDKIRTGPSNPDGSSGESALYGLKSVNVYFFSA